MAVISGMYLQSEYGNKFWNISFQSEYGNNDSHKIFISDISFQSEYDNGM